MNYYYYYCTLSLYNLLPFIVCGNRDPSEADRSKILSLAQDIVYAQDNRKMTPKHAGQAAAIPQATRSKTLVDTVRCW